MITFHSGSSYFVTGANSYATMSLLEFDRFKGLSELMYKYSCGKTDTSVT